MNDVAVVQNILTCDLSPSAITFENIAAGHLKLIFHGPLDRCANGPLWRCGIMANESSSRISKRDAQQTQVTTELENSLRPANKFPITRAICRLLLSPGMTIWACSHHLTGRSDSHCKSGSRYPALAWMLAFPVSSQTATSRRAKCAPTEGSQRLTLANRSDCSCHICRCACAVESS